MPTATTNFCVWQKTTARYSINIFTMDESSRKLYYTISEVAQEVGVTESTLRYWESVFKQIAPAKGTGGARRYTPKDLKMVKLVYHLVKDKGMTLAGAKAYLKDNKKMEKAEVAASVVERLRAIREELVALRDALGEL